VLIYLSSFLTSVGLQYEDLLIEQDHHVAEAVALADKDIATGRTRRLMRAIDLDFKKKRLVDYAPEMEQDPFKEELWPDIIKLKARDQEYALLNAHTKS
jgi:hypothetical protein